MAAFISLINFTQQGIKDVKDSPERAAKFSSMAEHAGAKVKEIYWTIGTYDAVIIMEAADDETVAAVMLTLGSFGSVRSQTLRAFNSSQIKEVISKMPG